MSKYGNLVVIGAIAAITIGLVSINVISAVPLLTGQTMSESYEEGSMIGHVTYEVRGPNGEIKNYIQSDNIIVRNGKNCAAQTLFANDTSVGTNSICAFTSGSTGFNFIAIGNGTQTPFDGQETGLADDNGGEGTGCTGTGDTCEMARKQGTITFTADTGSGTQVQIATTTPFNFTGITPDTITESGLFDDGILDATDNLFAIRDISVPVTNQDTLSVTWTITLS